MGGESQEFQVLPDRNFRTVSFAQQVIGDPKMAGREHVFAILVVLECTRFTD
jgi:hypothetical protein